MLRVLVIAGFTLLVFACRHSQPVPAPVSGTSGQITLTSGSTLALRIAEPIDSQNPTPNRSYAAVVSRDAKGPETQAQVPSGSPVTLTLMQPAESAATGPWELGLSSITINGDSFLVRGDTPNAAARLGDFLGGVPGTIYPDLHVTTAETPTGLVVSQSLIRVNAGSLLTFRLSRDIVLTGSTRSR